ncbi:helix-turn-helix transcriptional regulator [Nostoc sp. FACHB-152]|uniref:helix-turn-helix transcriptional regulator n=1 Tax=Nostoc sp. FACHB-152 TaxID=2692837 RepID=UPI001688C3BE|nr:AraC family transcriptional regulator [Nostoc sp. FACHB-152]MBD2446381.1 helix-turn-helix transcriptional regulator [Nostoc sp. FACHB-152]MBD2471790.1 helix-turn-helix transcriptional regulator [Nostoc sp. FACHB-145]
MNFIKQEESLQILPTPPILSSQNTGWPNVGLFYYRHPAHSTTEHYLTHHVLAIAYNQFQLEVRKDSKSRTQLVDNGVIQLTPANVSQWLHWDREGEFLIVTLCPQFMEKVVYESVKGNAFELIPQFSIIDPVIQYTAAALKAAIETESSPNALFGESAATMLAVHLLQAYATCKPVIKHYGDGLAKNKLQLAIDYINANLDQDIKLTDIAELLGISHYYFCHLFKQSVGITPHQYLIQKRIEKAKLLLKNRELSIAEVALECGFIDQSHLTKHFKRLVGLTPKAMRSQ